jgi:cold shock CspA family protein
MSLSKRIVGIRTSDFQSCLNYSFGFIETLSHEKEIFFHFSNFDGKSEKLEVGTEVEYCVFNREKGGKVSAEGVKVLRAKVLFKVERFILNNCDVRTK